MKTVFITGSTDGIGKLTAIKLAKEGHDMLLHGRNQQKLQETVSELRELSNNPKVNGFVSDLSDLDSIEKMIAEIAKERTSIDVLINNAGVFKSNIEVNKDGLDIRFAVNYLAPYLLTKGLLPLLKNGEHARVINLSSAAQASVDIEALSGTKQLSSQVAYAQSKLALTMWSFYLSKQHDSLNVIAVNPGSLLNTRMVKEAYGQHWSPADKGASILYELATSNQYANSSGTYYDNDKGAFSQAYEDAYNQDLILRLISETDKILHV